jgi:hypothetical protein
MLKIEIILDQIDCEKMVEKMGQPGSIGKSFVKWMNQTPAVFKNNAIAVYVALNKKNLTDKINDSLREKKLDIKVNDITVHNQC